MAERGLSNHNRGALAHHSTKRSSKYKEYQPKFTPVIPLPSTECFQLDYILNNVLAKESEQVNSDLLQVALNFQNDLRKEIKYKLLIEQRIQFKNIEIAKTASSLNKTILERKKKLHKCILNSKNDHIDSNMIDSEVNQLLKTASETSHKVKSLISRLTDLDKKLRGENKDNLVMVRKEIYPNLYRLMNKQEIQEDEVQDVETHDVTAPYESYFDSNLVSTSRRNNFIQDSLNEINSSVDTDTSGVLTTQEGQPEIISTTNSLVLLNSLHSISNLNQDEEDEDNNSKDITEEEYLDPVQFESFMKSSIAKYRKSQNKKHLDPFKNITTSETNSEPKNQASNPLTLLYSQLISNPKYIDSQRNGQYPFSNIVTIKSSATTKQTELISHHKKLRINGAPITSESLRRNKEKCKCSIADEETSNKTLEDALLEQLNISDHDLDGDEVWNSSELNSEEDDYSEENTVDELLSSESSDLDSSSIDEYSPINSTNQYYNNFKSDLKQKKRDKLSKRKTTTSKRKNRRSISLDTRELSPTPKHVPSHRILKPKRSILKSNSNNTQRFSKENSPFRKAGFVTDQLDDILSEEVSALSEVNNAYGSKTDNKTTNLTVQGTIIPFKNTNPNDEDSEQDATKEGIKHMNSLSLLRTYVL